MNVAAKTVNKNMRRRFFRSKKRAVRYGLVIVNLVLFFGVASFIVANRQNATGGSVSALLGNAANNGVINPIDKISGSDIAVNIAQLTRMDETVAVINNADSANTQFTTTQSSSQIVAKPQIVKTNLKSVSDVSSYKTVEGDTITEVAKKFGITTSSIKWSNGIYSDKVKVGKELVIPPVNGFVYKVKSGDTVKKLASKFNANEARIIAFNDIELSGLVEGGLIVIPDGEILPVVYGAASSYGFKASYGPYNGYDWGWCTWWVAERRKQVGRPLPTNLGNAVTWSSRARASGMTVSNVPVAGAVIWHDQSVLGTIAGGLGHVGFVEKVFPDGSIAVSDMNSRGTANIDGSGGRAGGFSRVSYRSHISPSEFYKYDFIY